jgi:hypothetical protein
VSKDIGYELRCAEPIPFDMEYTRDLGYCAASYLLEGGSGAMVSIQAGHLVPIPFEGLLDPATGRAGLLDCGAGGTGPLIYDVAAAVVYAGGMDRAAQLLDGYLAAGPVGREELTAALPVTLRFRWAVQADRWARDDDRAALARARTVLESIPD